MKTALIVYTILVTPMLLFLMGCAKLNRRCEEQEERLRAGRKGRKAPREAVILPFRRK